MPILDPVKNFALVEVSLGYDSDDTSIVLKTGDGAILPAPSTDGEFDLVWFNFTDFPNIQDDPDKEIVRVIARSTDTLTITRAQQDTTAQNHNTVGKVYKMAQVHTKKDRDDVENFLQSIGGASVITNETPTGLINSSNTVYTTTYDFVATKIAVYLNRTRLKLNEDYTETGANEITLGTAPTTGDDLFVDYVRTDTVLIGDTSYQRINETPTGLVNGSNTAYDTAENYIANSLQVYLNGQLLTKTEDYSETDSNTFTMVTAPATGDILRVTYQTALTPAGNADTLDGLHLLEIMSALNPVGTIREFNVSTNPATLLGFGTWSAYGTGRVTVAIDAGQTEFDTLGETGGAKTHTLTSSESGVPVHTHPENADVRMNKSASSPVYIASSGSSNWSNIESSGRAEASTKNNSAANASSAHNNLQPYIVVYRWVRTA